jgi:hypothetical protein
MSLIVAMTVAAAVAVPSCKSADHGALDFWLGQWHVKWDGGEGTNHISKTYDGCVIEEHFDGRPGTHLQGHSVSTYFAPQKQWRQTWVDNENGYIVLSGGPDGKGNFMLATQPVAGSAAANRMIFTDIKADSFTWRWQSTQDGRAWSDKWVIYYTRMKATAPT